MPRKKVDQEYSKDVAVSLVFIGQKIDPDIISEKLNLKPDYSIRAGENEISYNGLERPSAVGYWKLTKIVVSDNDFEFGTYKNWSKFLDENSAEIKKLARLGYEGYLEFHAFEGKYKNLYIAASLIERIEKSKLGISINWYTSMPILPDEDHQIEISEPDFLTEEDENNFFTALHSIKSIMKVVGFTERHKVRKGEHSAKNRLVLHLDKEFLTDVELRKLLALMARYKINMSVLKDQCNKLNKSWFKKRGMWWHESVFGKTAK